MISEQSFINNNKNNQEMEKRTKEEAQDELIEKFGLRKTSDFQEALKRGEFDLAEEWLNYIIENKMQFPQYLASWDSWLADRRREIIEAK